MKCHELRSGHSFFSIFHIEWRWWIAGAVVSFFLASVLMSGWPAGLLPELSIPYTYHGDGLAHSWMALRVIEGWIFDSPRSGYPFGSSFLDHPGSDAGNLLMLKILGWWAGSYQAALNLFFLLSFSVVFIASFCSLRAIGLVKSLAASASFLFTFLAFHFQRIEHLFYLWYFVIPIFFYFCFHFSEGKVTASTRGNTLKKWGLISLIFLVAASFGVYYALFGVILLGTSAAIVLIKTNNIKLAITPIIAVILVTAGVILNVAPNLAY